MVARIIVIAADTPNFDSLAALETLQRIQLEFSAKKSPECFLVLPHVNAFLGEQIPENVSSLVVEVQLKEELLNLKAIKMIKGSLLASLPVFFMGPKLEEEDKFLLYSSGYQLVECFPFSEVKILSAFENTCVDNSLPRKICVG